MRVRFQADADLNEHIVTGVLLRVPEIDFKTANQSLLEGVPDGTVLALAAAESRILVTHDNKTMPSHFAVFLEQSISWGVVVVRKKLSVRSVIEDLLSIWINFDAEDYKNRIKYLPL